MSYSFSERLQWSKENLDIVERLIKEKYPDCIKLERTNEELDKRGADFLIIRNNGNPLSIDIKKSNWNDSNTLCLETISTRNAITKEITKIGWTLDKDKCTEYIVWWWPKLNKIFGPVNFLQLYKIFSDNLESWKEEYGVKPQSSHGTSNNNWESEYIPVPREVVEKKLIELNTVY